MMIPPHAFVNMVPPHTVPPVAQNDPLPFAPEEIK